ncbi:MAG TPA: hypothetical protein VNC61_16900 [Acidimicrobiales bacterium]|nr:hypothetical protein [Acidimicrobiales bacterium]
MAAKVEMSTLAFNRSLSPMGGRAGSAVPASWRAGQMDVSSDAGTVTRLAWSMTPAATSSGRTKPARMGRPAASAAVKPAVGRASDPRGKTAPDPALQELPPWTLWAAKSS